MSRITDSDKSFLVDLTFDVARYINSLKTLELLFYPDNPDKIEHREVKFFMGDSNTYSIVLSKIRDSLPKFGGIAFYSIKYTLIESDICVSRNCQVEFRLTKFSDSRVIPEYSIDYIVGTKNGL